MTACVASVNLICWDTSFPSDLELSQLQSDHTVQSHSILGLHHGKVSKFKLFLLLLSSRIWQ